MIKNFLFKLIIYCLYFIPEERINRTVEPTYLNVCNCAEFLAPLNSWEDVYTRNKEQSTFIPALICLTEDDSEDWVIHLYRCADCGRYWASEDAGSPWVTKAFPFYYHIETNDPRKWLRQSFVNDNLLTTKLDTSSNEFERLILPEIRVKS